MSTVTESGYNPATEAQKRQHEFLVSPLPPTLTSHIQGNAPASIKELPVKWLAVFRSRGNSFAHSIAERMQVVEVDIVPNIDDEEKMEGRVVIEVDVTPGAPSNVPTLTFTDSF
jgi:acyl-coenzyme A thioesterase 13